MSKRIMDWVFAVAACVTIGIAAAPARAGTGFTYQGRIDKDGIATSGSCDFQFGLFNAAGGIGQVGAIQAVPSVAVSDGVFSVVLNAAGEFGAAPFGNDDRYLEIMARCPAGSGSYSTLTPRQRITSAPSALFARSVADNAVAAAQIQSNAVNSSKIADGTIGEADVGFNYAGSVTKAGAANVALALSCLGCVDNHELSSANSTMGQVLTATQDGVSWRDPGPLLPFSGTASSASSAFHIANTNGGAISAYTSNANGFAAIFADGAAPGATGIEGRATSGKAVSAVATTSGTAVNASSQSGFAVYARSNENTGIIAYGTTGVVGHGASIGLRGDAVDAASSGVYGASTAVNGNGVFGSVDAHDSTGVRGFAGGASSIGISGTATAASSTGVYGMGSSVDGIGVYGRGRTGVSGVASSFLGVGVSAEAGGSVEGLALYADGKTGTGISAKGAIAVDATATSVAVKGVSQGSPGIQGESSATGGTGISGQANTGINAIGVKGLSTDGTGVSGKGTLGVYGESNKAGGTGVQGTASGNSAAIGVSGTSASGIGVRGTGGTGMRGVSTNGTGVWGESGNVAVFAQNTGGNVAYLGTQCCAADLYGLVAVHGNLSVSGSKNFEIDHPLDPAGRILSHAAIESSEVLNVYSGIVQLDDGGSARVALADWMEALNRDFRYQITAIGGPAPGLHIAEEVHDGSFTIGGGAPGLRVSWQLTGVRNDAWARKNPLVVEKDKAPRARGLYLDPEAHGVGEDKRLVAAQQCGNAGAETP